MLDNICAREEYMCTSMARIDKKGGYIPFIIVSNEKMFCISKN